MKKHTYRAQKVNNMNWQQVNEQSAGEALVLAVDVAKVQQYALLTNQEHTQTWLMQWSHLEHTQYLIEQLKTLEVPITVVLESTGTYGDSLRYQCRQAGFTIFQANAKKVHDAREIYDGVPSLHDAKAAWLIAKLHKDGATKPWCEPTEEERRMNALRLEYELHQDQYRRNQNRLEAYLSRHWPEVLTLMPLDSVTLEQLIKTYGSPQGVVSQSEQAASDMRGWGKSGLSAEKIALVIASAINTLGEPCIEAERQFLMALAGELHHSRQQKQITKQALEAIVENDEALREMGRTVGKVTTAVLISLHLDPRRFATPKSYQKALGVNLTEKSSGQLNGRLRLSKRGSATARKFLYLAALRLLVNDPLVGKWYKAKKDDRAKLKTVIALMRKLPLALWHIARGERFDAGKLLKVAV
jgi:transposase